MSMDVLSNSSIHTLSTPKKVIFDIAMQLGQIDMLDPNSALIYITYKIEKMKNKISPKEYLMAEKAAQYRCEQVGSFDFLDHPMASMSDSIGHKFIEAKVAVIHDTNQNIQEDLFKGFLTFYIIQDIITRKKDPKSRQIIMIHGDYHLPEKVTKAAKNAHIEPKSIHVYKSWVEINLEKGTITRKDWYQQPWIQIPLDWETHNHPTEKDSYSWTFFHDGKLVTYTTGEDWQIYDDTGKSIGITWLSWHPDPVGEPGEEGVDGIGKYNAGPRGSNGPGYPSLFGKQE